MTISAHVDSPRSPREAGSGVVEYPTDTVTSRNRRLYGGLNGSVKMRRPKRRVWLPQVRAAVLVEPKVDGCVHFRLLAHPSNRQRRRKRHNTPLQIDIKILSYQVFLIMTVKISKSWQLSQVLSPDTPKNTPTSYFAATRYRNLLILSSLIRKTWLLSQAPLGFGK